MNSFPQNNTFCVLHSFTFYSRGLTPFDFRLQKHLEDLDAGVQGSAFWSHRSTLKQVIMHKLVLHVITSKVASLLKLKLPSRLGSLDFNRNRHNPYQPEQTPAILLKFVKL